MQQKISLKAQLKSLGVGESASFPISKTPNVRTSASELGLTLLRKYATSTDRVSATIIVTRIA